MHAIVVTASVDTGREQEGREHLRANVVPAVKQIPGFVGAYWLASGLSVLLFDSEDAARSAADALPNAPRPDFASIGDVDVHEVVAHA